MTELADILNEHGQKYIDSYGLSPEQLKALSDITSCRTSKLGGHADVCEECGHLRISYNSCRNRHCPKCQGLLKEKWIEDRKKDLLPIQYHHIVFTIPNNLNDLVLRNKQEMYTLLFKASSETLKELAADPKYLNANIGFISILHTWGQNLMDHPHIHCIVTGGGLSLKNKEWISSKNNFFLPVKVISSLFKGKFMACLRKIYDHNKLSFFGNIDYLQKESDFQSLVDSLYSKKWVVFSKPSFANPEAVIEYLGRYINKVAISNHRIIKMEDGKVTFRYKDYSDDAKKKYMTLDVFEFIRRFLLHLLPKRFVRIRYYGILCHRYRKRNLLFCRYLLNVYIKRVDNSNLKESWQDILFRLTGKDLTVCPKCGGNMVSADNLYFIRPSPV
ncbi:MAG: IS91 family transposase [Halanaerobiales bacterium]|nr:IS91 family transposase [Halanaerobiales bacterium]